MIAIHPIHRRLAALVIKSEIKPLSKAEKTELKQCLIVNAQIVFQLDKYKNLSFLAYETGDTEWLGELCEKIDGIENRMK